MANSKTNYIDPNVFLQAAAAGTAQSPADRTASAWTLILKAFNSRFGYETVDTTATALDITLYKSELTVSGTMTATLAAPTFAGQEKLITCVAAASVPALTLTVSSPDDTTGFVCPATFFFDNKGQTLLLRATAGLKWRCIQKIRTGVKALTIGTTVTTGICDMSHVDVSVTGTVASTSTKALPNGAAVGELCAITCSTAASTPHGDLGGTFVKKDGTAGTALDDFTATSDSVLLQWTGAAWQPVAMQTTALAVV